MDNYLEVTTTAHNPQGEVPVKITFSRSDETVYFELGGETLTMKKEGLLVLMRSLVAVLSDRQGGGPCVGCD